MSLVSELAFLPRGPETAHFPELRRLARGVARRFKRGADMADELVSAFLLELALSQEESPYLALARAEGPNEALLRAYVRRRLHQLAVREMPRWELFRSLHKHVKKVVGHLPTAPTSQPAALTGGPSGRLSRPRVAEAVAWVLQQHLRAPRREPALAIWVTRLLLEVYYPVPVVLEEKATVPDGRTDPERQAHRRSASRALLEQLSQDVERREIKALARLSQGETLQEIARRSGVSVATVHGWKVRALLALRDAAARHRNSEETVREVFARARREMLTPEPEPDTLERKADERIRRIAALAGQKKRPE